MSLFEDDIQLNEHQVAWYSKDWTAVQSSADSFKEKAENEFFEIIGAINNKTKCSIAQKDYSKYMVEKKYGRIINIASMYGLVGNTAMDTVAYHSSKGGVVNFTRAVAAELAKYNITCNAICPGYFATELTIDVLKIKKP